MELIKFGPKTFVLGLLFIMLSIGAREFMFFIWRPFEPLALPFFAIGACLLVASLLYGEQIDEWLTWENMRWPYAFTVAAIADVLDFVLIHLFGLPIVGDLGDLITMALLFPAIGKYALIGAAEFVPVIGDLLPMHTASVIAALFGFGEE